MSHQNAERYGKTPLQVKGWKMTKTRLRRGREIRIGKRCWEADWDEVKRGRMTDKKIKAKETGGNVSQRRCYSHKCVLYSYRSWNVTNTKKQERQQTGQSERTSHSFPKWAQFNRYHLKNGSLQLQVNTENSALEIPVAAVVHCSAAGE